MALEWSAAGRDPEPFGGLQLRAYGTTRAEMLAFNLVMCGLSHGTWLPCWFRDEKRVDQARVDATGEWLELPSLVSPPRGASLPLEDAHRAVHDAYVSADDDLWILGWTRGASDAARSSLRRLLRFDEQGTQTGDYLLPRPARLLLGVYGPAVIFSGRGWAHRRAEALMQISVVRFFWATTPPPRTLVLLWTALTGGGVWWMLSGASDSTGLFAVCLYLQMFAVSSGFMPSARAGHFDPLLGGLASRVRSTAAHWLLSSVPGVTAWVILGSVEWLISERGAAVAFRTSSLAAIALSQPSRGS